MPDPTETPPLSAPDAASAAASLNGNGESPPPPALSEEEVRGIMLTLRAVESIDMRLAAIEASLIAAALGMLLLASIVAGGKLRNRGPA